MTQNRRIKVEFSEQGLSSKIPKPKFFLGQLVEVKDENNEEYLITGITLNYSKDSYPMWEYHVGTNIQQLTMNNGQLTITST
ncbi:hypothetical protein [Crocosphaera sp. XPORK-15E]|uniref:hypothetical protein n=1 Tax=Crocosphaera sp. XPORK-15E TaxID=3110247 RepID=UPI002B202E8F|nr:hypothetical protein [Crocosphaera sp. XPORK-15E]MEA5537116.1 hypothetical protein [Crocosphaera sp. XPORK-15E]